MLDSDKLKDFALGFFGIAGLVSVFDTKAVCWPYFLVSGMILIAIALSVKDNQ